MHAKYALPLLGAALAHAQGQGEGYPPPPPQTLETTKSGVLPVLPTPSAEFTGVEVNEGAIISPGSTNPTFQPLSGPAPTQTGLPMATYQAMLPPTNFDDGFGSTVTGSIMISSNPSAPGVMVQVNLHGIPDVATYGPFPYHVHTLAVPADGNCTATMGHLDPTNRGEYYPCDASDPASCQVGDLSGKNGKIMNSGDFSASYSDAYLSTRMGDPSFVGDKSIVIHSGNTTRITCANFMMMGMGMGNGTMGGGASATGTGAMPSYSAPVQTGGAAAFGYGVAAAGAAVVAAVL